MTLLSLIGASVANRISRISDVLIGSPLPCDVHASGALMMLTLGVDVDAKVLSTDAPAIGAGGVSDRATGVGD